MEDKKKDIWQRMLSNDVNDQPNTEKFLAALKKIAGADFSEIAGIDPGQLAFDCARHLQHLKRQRDELAWIASKGGFIKDSDGLWCKAGDMVRVDGDEGSNPSVNEITFDEAAKQIHFKRVNTSKTVSPPAESFTLLAAGEPRNTGVEYGTILKEIEGNDRTGTEHRHNAETRES